MSQKPLYEFDDEEREIILRHLLEFEFRGKLTGSDKGQFGKIYSIERELYSDRLAVKCPLFKKFENRSAARDAIGNLLHEVEKTHQVFRVPWVNRINDVKIICGWPFLQSRYRDGTLEGLIANPLLWTLQDKFCSLIQIIRALRLAETYGIAAHQDLKPANIFFDDKVRSFPDTKGTKGIRFWIYVADFGLADAFRDFGRNSGSRPYMPPEQLSSAPIDPSTPTRIDVFALGVICHECLTDGRHPIGEVTSDVWPWRDGMDRKWKHEEVWKKWSKRADKTLPATANDLPPGISELILAALAPAPSDRPSLADFEATLWEALDQIDSETHAALRMQIEYFEGLSSDDSPWPHMDDRLMQLRQFYSST